MGVTTPGLSRAAGMAAAPLGFLTLTALLLLVPVATASAQEGVVAGQVLAAHSLQPIAGAQVIVEGTDNGAITDSRGYFRIQNLSGSQVTLRVAMLGYRTVTDTVRVGATDLRFLLRESAVELDEIVVTGTAGRTERRAIGNSVATVAAADVQAMAPSTDVTRLINGRAPGVVVAPGTGMVGAGPRIRIRGAATLSLSDQPLIYVD